MKRKGAKHKTTKSKKHQEDPQPLKKYRKISEGSVSEKTGKLTPKGDNRVFDRHEKSSSSEGKLEGDVKSDVNKDGSERHSEDKTSLISIGKSKHTPQAKRKHGTESEQLISNFWERSRQKYKKISENKNKTAPLKLENDNSSKVMCYSDIKGNSQKSEERKLPLDGEKQFIQKTLANSDNDEVVNETHKVKKPKQKKKKNKKKKSESNEKVLPSISVSEPDPSTLERSFEVESSSADEQQQCIVVDVESAELQTDEKDESKMENDEIKGLTVINFSCGVILAMEKSSEICFHGNCSLKPLCGSFSVLGSHLEKRKNYDCFSPNTNSFLTITCRKVEKKEHVITEILDHHGVDLNQFEIPTKKTALIKVEHLNSRSCEIIPKYPPFLQIFGRHDNDKTLTSWRRSLYKVGMHVIDSEPKLKFPSVYTTVKDMAESLVRNSDINTPPPVISVVGGKNSGKSTLNRYLLNSLLNKVKKVFFLECDVGQTEFTPPGCVSLHCISDPLLGPPFTHQRPAVFSCFFGGVTPNDDPTRYLTCIEECFSRYLEVSEGSPLIVNTMGWNTGVGLALTVDTIRLIHPLLLVQINTRKATVNFPPLSPEFVQMEPGWSGKIWDKRWKYMDDLPEYQWITIDSPVNTYESNIQKYRPSDHRDLTLLSYFSGNLELGMTVTSSTPYIIQWKSVAMHVCHSTVERSQIMYAINGTLVALCQADLSETERDNEESPLFFKKTPICNCLGFGIIRGIDPVKKELYVITPLSLDVLKNVNTLLRGAVNLPNMLMTHQKCEWPLPYVMNTISTAGSEILRQRNLKPRKKPVENIDQ